MKRSFQAVALWWACLVIDPSCRPADVCAPYFDTLPTGVASFPGELLGLDAAGEVVLRVSRVSVVAEFADGSVATYLPVD
jgi:hypothetical protein